MKVEETVSEILASLCAADATTILPEHRLRVELDMDDMSFVELGMALEDEMQVRVPDCDLDAFRTVGDIVRYVKGNN